MLPTTERAVSVGEGRDLNPPHTSTPLFPKFELRQPPNSDSPHTLRPPSQFSLFTSSKIFLSNISYTCKIDLEQVISTRSQRFE